MESEPEMEIEMTKSPLANQPTGLSEADEDGSPREELEVQIEAPPEDNNDDVLRKAHREQEEGEDPEEEGEGEGEPEGDESEGEEEEEQQGEPDEEVSMYSIKIYSNCAQSRDVDHDYCEVCYSTVSKKFMQDEFKHLFDLIRCKNCNKKVHHICYGINTPVEEQTDEFETSVKYFLCDKCKEGIYAEEATCYICGVKEGSLRLSRDHKWVHTLCAMGSTAISFRDVTTMTTDLSSFRKRGQKISASKKCGICKTKVQTFPCVNGETKKHYHLHCALRRELLKPIKSHCKVYFGLESEQSLVLHKYLDEAAVMSNIEDLALSLKEVIEETGMSRTYGFPKDLKGRKSTTKAGKETKKRARREGSEVSRFVKELFEKSKSKAEKNFEDDLLDIDQDREEQQTIPQPVGGKILLFNTSKMTPEELRLIQEEEEEEQEQVEENLMEVEGNPFETTASLISSFYQEITSVNSLLEVYSEDKLPKLKSDLRAFPSLKKLNFPEVLFFVNVYQRRAQACLNNLATLEDLERLIRSANTLPFSLVGMLKPLNEKYYTGISTDALLRANVEQCVPEPAYVPAKRRFDEVLIRRNNKTIDQVMRLENIYLNEPCKVLTQQFEDLRIYYKQLVFLHELYSEIADYFNYSDMRTARTTPTQAGSRFETPSKGLVVVQDKLPNIPLSKLLSLFSKSSRLDFPENFAELELLKEFVGGSKDLLSVEGLRPAGESLSEASRSGKSSPRQSPRRIAEGKRSIGKFVEMIPVAPISLASNQKGRPKKAERVINEIEKDYKIQLKRIKELPTLKEAEDALEEARKSGYQRKADMIEASIAKVIEWKRDFEDAVDKNDGSLGTLVEKIELIGVYISEMATALEYRKDWSLWRSNVVSLQRRLKKKVENFFADTEEMVSYDELEEAIDEAKRIIHLESDDGVFRDLKEKFRAVQKLRQELTDKDMTPQLAQLKQFKRELKALNVRIPELKTLQKMLAINENLKRLVDEPIGLKKLEEKTHGLQYVPEKVDATLWESLKTKISEGKRIKEEAQGLLAPRATYRVEEIAQMARLLRDVSKYNVEVEEIDKIKKTVDEFLRLAKVYAMVVGVDAIDSYKLENEDYPALAGKTMEELVAECQAKLEEDEEVLNDKKARELDEVYRGFSYESVENANIRKFFDRVAVALWKSKAKAFLQSDFKRTSQEVEKFIADIPQIDQLTNEDINFFRKIQQTGKRVQKWKGDVQKLFETNPKQELLELADKADRNEIDYDGLKEQLEEVGSKFKRLSDEYEEELAMYSDLEEDNYSLTKILKWVEWILLAYEMKRQIEDELKPLEYHAVKRSYEKMDQLGLPKSRSLCKTVSKWHDLAENLRQEFVKGYQDKRVELKKMNLEGSAIKKLVDKNKGKMSLEEANRMLDKLEGAANVVVLSDEVSKVKEDLNKFDEWKEKVREVTEKYIELLEPQGEEDMGTELDGDFKRDLARLKADMLDLPIRDEKTERDLQELDWSYEVALAMQDEKKEASYDEWKKLLKSGERFETRGREHIQKLVKTIKAEIEKADNLKAFAKLLRKADDNPKENKVSIEEAALVVEEVENMKIPMKEEKKTIEHYYNLAKRLRDKVRRMVEPEGEEKALEEEFLRLQESVKKLPIDLPVEAKALEHSIQQAHKLANAVKRARMDDPKWMEKIAQQYEECPIFIEKVARIAKSFDDVRQSVTSLKEKRQTLADEDNVPDYDELQDLGKKVDNIQKLRLEDQALKETKVEIFLKKCEVLERKMFGSTIGPAVKMTIGEIKALIREGSGLQKDFPENEKLEGVLDFLEDVFKQAEGKIAAIKKIDSKTELDTLPKVVMGIVDVSKEIREQKKSLGGRKEESEESEDEKEKRGRSQKRRARSQSEERDRRSKEKSREREKKSASTSKGAKTKKTPEKSKGSTSRPRKDSGKKSVDRTKDTRESLIANLKTEAQGKITNFFGNLIKLKPMLKSKQLIITDLKNVLDQGRHLDLKFTDSFKYAEMVFASLPEMVESRESYERIIRRLKTLMSYPYISKSILKMEFDEVYLRHLVKKELGDLKLIEERLREESVKELVYEAVTKKPQKPTRKPEEEEEEEGEEDIPIKKKPKATPLKPSVRFPEEETRQGKASIQSKVSQGSRKPSVVKKSPVDKVGDEEKESPDRIQPRIVPKNLQPTIKEKEKSRTYQPGYDPDNPRKESEIWSSQDLYNPETPGREEKKTPVREEHKDQILKIFSGSLKWEEDRTSPKMILYSCDSVEVATSIPNLRGENGGDLKINREIPWKNFEEYFSDILKTWRRGINNIQIMAGWVEPEASIYASRFEQIANDMLRYEKVGVCEYIQSSRIIFLHKQQMRRDWATQLDLRVKKARKTSKSALYFVIVFKPYKLKQPTKSLDPEIVQPLQEDMSGKSSLVRQDSFEDIWEDTAPKSPYASSLKDYGSEYGPELDEGEKVNLEPKTLLGKRTFEEAAEGVEDQELDELEQLIKKLKDGRVEDKEKLVEQLENLEQDQIVAIARELDQTTRDYMIDILREADTKEKMVTENVQKPTFVVPEPHREGVKGPYVKYTPQIPTGTTMTSSPYRMDSGRTTTKSTPMERAEEAKRGREGYVAENDRAFESLEPSEVVEKVTVVEEVTEITVNKQVDWSKVIQGEIDLGNGIKISNGAITLPKDLYEKALRLGQQGLEGAHMEEAKGKEGEEAKEGQEGENQPSEKEPELVESRDEKEGEKKTGEEGVPSKIILDDVEIEEEPLEKEKKVSAPVQIELDLSDLNAQKRESMEEEGKAEQGKAVEEKPKEQEVKELSKPKAMYIESKVVRTREVHVIELDEENQEEQKGEEGQQEGNQEGGQEEAGNQEGDVRNPFEDESPVNEEEEAFPEEHEEGNNQNIQDVPTQPID